MISSCEENRKKLTHVDTTAAIDALREHVSSLNLSCERATSLARLQRQTRPERAMSLARMQRQTRPEQAKAVNQLPSINFIFRFKSKR